MTLDKLVNLVLDLRNINQSNWSLIIGDRLYHLTDPDDKEFYTGVIEGLIAKVRAMEDLTDEQIKGKILDEAAYITSMFEANSSFTLSDMPPISDYKVITDYEGNSYNDLIIAKATSQTDDCSMARYACNSFSLAINTRMKALDEVLFGRETHQNDLFESDWYRNIALDKGLYNLPYDRAFTIREACEGVEILGKISGESAAKPYLRAGFGGLVLCTKKEEVNTWKALMQETDRLDDLIIFSINGDWSFPLCQYQANNVSEDFDNGKNLLQVFMAVHDCIEEIDDPYWTEALQQLVHNAINLCLVARENVTISLLYDLVHTAAQTKNLYKSKEWQDTSLCWKLISEAHTRDFDAWDQYDFHTISSYWLEAFPNVSSRTQSRIISMFTRMMKMFLDDPFQMLFSELEMGTRKVLLPELTHNGTVIIMDFPTTEFGNAGRAAQVAYKTVWQQATRGRVIKRNSRPVFFWADEVQGFVDENDLPLSLKSTDISPKGAMLDNIAKGLSSRIGKIAASNPLKLAVFGKYTTGKSTFVNSFINELKALPRVIDDNFLAGYVPKNVDKQAKFDFTLIREINDQIPGMQLLILCSTQESIFQVASAIHEIIQYKSTISIEVICGRNTADLHGKLLNSIAHIVISMPVYISNFIESNVLKIGDLKAIIIDGNGEDIDANDYRYIDYVFRHMPIKKQNDLYSVIIPNPTLDFAHAFQKNPILIRFNEKESVIPYSEQKDFMLPVWSSFKGDDKRATKSITRLLQDLNLFGDMQSKVAHTCYEFSNEQIIAILVERTICSDKNNFMSHNSIRNDSYGERCKNWLNFESYFNHSKSSLGKDRANVYDPNTYFNDHNFPYQNGMYEKNMIRIMLSIGRKDYIRPDDIIGAISVNANIPSSTIGNVDVFDKYTYVNVARNVVNHVLNIMDGNTIKGCMVNVEIAR